MTEYASQGKGTYSTGSQTVYGPSTARVQSSDQLYIVDNQVKEQKGVCTCQKKTSCRGTCRA